jgi:hypothetical protein
VGVGGEAGRGVVSRASARRTDFNPASPIPIEEFGRDHWSTFGYLEVRVVDHGGVVDRRHMRCHHGRHPQFAHEGGDAVDTPTRLRGGFRIYHHDDWDCLEDLEAAGLLESGGTGLHPVYSLTDLGREVVGKLRAHKARGGTWDEFSWRPS